MPYRVVLRESARKVFDGLDRAEQRRIEKFISRLAENPRPGQATRLVGDPRTWRARAGAWRVLYEIRDDQLAILVLDIKRRSEAYGGH